MACVNAFVASPVVSAKFPKRPIATKSYHGKPLVPTHPCFYHPFTFCMIVQPQTQHVTVVSTPPIQKPPAAAFSAAVTLGEMKANQPVWKIFLLGIIAGAYIAIGALLALTVGGAVSSLKDANIGLAKMVLGAFGLPLGLTMVVTAGGELFTGNTLLVTAALLSGRATLGALWKNWIASFVGNFVGSLFVVHLAVMTGCLSGASVATAIGIATAKVGLSFWQAFARGIACNWLVCMGVYMSNGASDFVGKFMAVWLPVSAFVAMGFDHSVANMFLVPMGKAVGAKVGWKAFLASNLVPVTLGNVVGGAVLVALVYYLAYGSKKKA